MTQGKRDRIRGSLIGGAVGDALGYAIEFWSENEIFYTYGPGGISSYELRKGKAVISDDTQMTLFTANGILVGETVEKMNGAADKPRKYVADAYHDWYRTQNRYYDEERSGEKGNSWLLGVPELFYERAPGMTCLSALSRDRSKETDYLAHPINQSKGCGGIMRIAPIALRDFAETEKEFDWKALDMESAQFAAITHGHSLGYMPAAVTAHIIGRILTNQNDMSLKEIVEEAKEAAIQMFAGDSHLQELVSIIDLAVRLSENNDSDLDNIHRLGEGWVAEETLGISLYCALKYQNDFSKAVIAAVNHKGDSDSTGAVTGNIVGALIGYEAIEEKWKTNLELREVILEMADDLYTGCPDCENGVCSDPEWNTKYVMMRRYRKH